MTTPHQQFEAVMNSGAPIVDMVGDGRMEYDGPRCVTCGSADVDNDGEMCEPCGDAPHPFQARGIAPLAGFCACGRIESIGGYSPVHTEPACSECRGSGGWQQHDGLIIECPRGCMVGGEG